MACCKCCCEGGDPAGVCCGSPETCCVQPDHCCEDDSPTYCCEEDETCCDGTCCPVGEKCCQDDSTSYCCPDNETCCGGICCPSGYICCNGICCAPDEFCCDGVCQAGPCDCDPPCDTDACESCIEVTEGVFECQPYCSEAETCCDGTCCADDECCVFGTCEPCNCDPPCTSDSCEVCTQVSTGVYGCVSSCDPGECCVDGVCGSCPCEPVCTGCSECVDGDCVSTCAEGESCCDGVCQAGPCDPPCEPPCDGCSDCIDGDCVSSCGESQNCCDGACQDEPCVPPVNCGNCQTVSVYNNPCGTQTPVNADCPLLTDTEAPCGCFGTPDITVTPCNAYPYSGMGLPAEYDNCACYFDSSYSQHDTCNVGYDESGAVICVKYRTCMVYRAFVYAYIEETCEWKRISDSGPLPFADPTVCNGYGDCACPELPVCNPEVCAESLPAPGCPCEVNGLNVENPLP